MYHVDKAHDMSRVYVNRRANNYLCIVSHSFYTYFLAIDRLHRYLPVSTRRTSRMILHREMANVLFIDIFKRILPDVKMSHSSVNHGRSKSIMLVNKDARTFQQGRCWIIGYAPQYLAAWRACIRHYAPSRRAFLI